MFSVASLVLGEILHNSQKMHAYNIIYLILFVLEKIYSLIYLFQIAPEIV